MVPLTPQELLKERGWEKLVTDKMKSIIDDNIEVLRQDYSELLESRKAKESGNAEQAAGGQAAGDGTQIRTYINNVMIKINMSEVIKKKDNKK